MYEIKDTSKINEIINLNPSCPSNIKEKASETICNDMYVCKQIKQKGNNT